MLNWFAILVAVYTLITVGSGAIVTSSKETIGTENSRLESPTGAAIHPVVGGGLAGLTLALAVGLWASKRNTLRTSAIAAIVFCASNVILGVSPSLGAALTVLHAWLAAAFFATLSAIVLFTSEHWERKPELVGDHGFRFLRPLAIVTPPLVLIQVVLGAMYRHKVTSVFWHMGGALLVSLATLVGSMVVIQQFPAHRALKNAATALTSIVLTQVALGVTAFTLQLLDTDNPLALELATVSHVVIGNLTLAASLIFAIEAHRCIRPGEVER